MDHPGRVRHWTDGRPKLLDNGVWQVVSGTGKFERFQGSWHVSSGSNRTHGTPFCAGRRVGSIKVLPQTVGSPFPALRVIGPRHHAPRPPSAHFQDRQERGGDPRSGCLLLAACSRCGPLCLFAPTRQPQAFTVNPCLYLYVTRLAQHLAPHLRLNVMFPFCVGHNEHLRPKRAAFGAKVGV